jgi:hypothetical protein
MKMYDQIVSKPEATDRQKDDEEKGRSTEMTNAMMIRVLPPRQTPAQTARVRARRRRALVNTLLEAFATVGLGACFILCALAVLCVL